MRLRVSTPLLVAAVAIVATPFAQADDAGLVQVRLGNAVPWVGPASGAVSGSSAQLLGVPGTPWTSSLPSWLRWALEPQVQVLSITGTAGTDKQTYHGLTWSVPLASGLLHQDDALSFGF